MILAVFIVGLMLMPLLSHALVPPDLLFSVGSSVVQIFSVVAVVIGGLFSGLVFAARRWLVFSKQNIWLVIGVIGGLVLLAIVVVYALEGWKQKTLLATEVVTLQKVNTDLQQQLQNSVPLSQYQQLLTELTTGSPTSFLPTIVVSTSSPASFAHEFYSDTITLYSAEKTFTLELDFNRIESSPGVFTHYTFLHGNIADELISDYVSQPASVSALQPNRFVTQIDKPLAKDLSPRDTYTATVLVAGYPLTFNVTGLVGDFVTRHLPTQTQHQSVGVAEVTYRGETFPAEALVEYLYSTDYTKQIFFPGYQTIESTTHQFVLWDETGDFYLIDISDVRSDTPEYPSHKWLLFKDAETGQVQKSFMATVQTATDEQGRLTWSVTAPEFNNAVLTLTPVIPFKQSANDRKRTQVTGTVTDGTGVRAIGGVLHLVE